ncbi:MAG: threonine/serine exporter family protein [Cocleimonas sp.]
MSELSPELNPEESHDQQYDAACQFIIKLGTAVHHYGPSAARLESYLTAVCNALGYDGVFRSTPSEITFAFSKPDQWWQRTHIAVVPVGGYNMSKLSQVGNLVEELVANKYTLTEASNRLDEIEAMSDPWGLWSYPLSFTLVSFGFSGILQGSSLDIIVSVCLSLVVCVLVILADRWKGRFLDALPFTSAFVAGSCAAAVKLWFPELNHIIVILAAIVVLIPGFIISAGIVEIVENYIIAGLARLFGGLVYLIKQFTGAWLGISFISLFGTLELNTLLASTSNSTTMLSIASLIIGLCFAYQTLLKDCFWVLINCSLAYSIVLSSSQLVSADLGILFGATVASMFANLWARTTKRPTSIVLIPALTILVSGSIGFRGLLTAATQQTDQGMQMFIQMFIVALAIAAGLLIANIIVRPKISL